MKAKYPSLRGFTLIELLVVMSIIAVLATGGFAAFQRAQEASRRTAASKGLKNISDVLVLYAGDHSGRYPSKDDKGNELTSANDAFRELFKDGIVSDESVFEVTPSAAVVDGNIGEPPEYIEALRTGECHWAMVKNATQESPGTFPVVWENSLTGGWDPSWDPTIEKTMRGRTWSGGQVLILLQGGSIKTMKIEHKDKVSKLTNFGSGSRNAFTQSGVKQVLDPSGLN